jgi:hypothetical protein
MIPRGVDAPNQTASTALSRMIRCIVRRTAGVGSIVVPGWRIVVHGCSAS